MALMDYRSMQPGNKATESFWLQRKLQVYILGQVFLLTNNYENRILRQQQGTGRWMWKSGLGPNMCHCTPEMPDQQRSVIWKWFPNVIRLQQQTRLIPSGETSSLSLNPLMDWQNLLCRKGIQEVCKPRQKEEFKLRKAIQEGGSLLWKLQDCSR